MKALLLAEACNPEWFSIPLAGFNTSWSLVRHPDIETTLVTHKRNRDAISRHEISDRTEIVYIDNEWIARPMYNLGRLLRGGRSLGWTTNMAVNWPAYLAFEAQVEKQFRSRLRSGEYDIVHRVTPVSPTYSSPLANWTDVPMIIGPLNGGLPWPKEFPALHASEREWLAPIRNVYRRLPYYRSSYRRLAGVISGSSHTATEVPDCFSGRQYHMPENGINAERFQIADGWTEPENDFRFISVGRLVPYKGFDMVIEAMAASPLLRTCRLDIVGDGPKRGQLETQASECGLADRVRFSGWISQPELSDRLRSSQAFAFPSLREFGGSVVLEAMASGLPSVIVDYGGPAGFIDDSCGIRIPMNHRSEIVANLIQAMESLVQNPNRCRSMALGAVESVKLNYTWEQKAKRIRQWYGEVLGHSQTAAPGPNTVGPDTAVCPETAELCEPVPV